MRLLLLVNGPGELYSWAVPLFRYLKNKGWKVSLKLLPCQFSSGLEEVVAREEGLDLSQGEEKYDVVLQLGGDAFWGWREKRRRRVPVLRYGFGLGGIFSYTYDSYLLPHHRLKLFFGRRKRATVVGSLSSDRVCYFPSRDVARKRLGIGKEFLLGIFPGSRVPIWRRASSFLRELISFLPQEITYLVGRSPFIPKSEPSFLPEASPDLLLSASDLLLTLPGTNTLEASALGTPMLVVAPFQFIDLVPVSGVIGFISSLPFLGKRIKLLALSASLAKRRFLSWPNRLLGKSLVPEMYGDVTPRKVANAIVEIMENEPYRRVMREKLPRIVGGPGASWRIEEVLKRYLRS
ncbi:MAG: hypothetical protein J7M13_01865 [Synergistetes bacterium]|nr:hypothetical protein [Synergistota bacterium]